MSEFMDRAKAEAEQTIDHMGEGAWADGVRYGIYVGVASAAEQEPSDEEVDAAARALCDITYGLDWPRLVDGWKNKPYPDFPHLVDDLRDQARAALLAAQKVRAGQ